MHHASRPTETLTAHRPLRPDPGPNAQPGFNAAESPLAWLRSRRGKNGAPLISEVQFLAGERLRRDFERAMLNRRVTTNWDLAGAGSRASNSAAEASDQALAARERYLRALDSVGPELSGILAHVCCLSAGLEQAERLLTLPRPRGKAVLGLALTALARHYGFLEHPARPAGQILNWGLADYRPSIPRPEEAAGA
ncbi:MAG: DUF6456 domain-containing protein [Aestuariivirga sp.]|uniref:DUF6456 domain-containing protein n=1 Tax=Aestuariivirga sp. TaxID=2650926 RepID=UPI0038D1DB0D